MTPRPSAIDPILGVLAPRALASPLTAAATYGVLATGTSLIAAAFEQRLIGTTFVQWGHTQLEIHPLLSNFSTLLDFAILNPLVIYFLLRSRLIVVTEPLLAVRNSLADKALQWFASLSCVALTVVLMIAYSHSFVYGDFFDAVVAISNQGECFVTVTGWVVYFWTGLITYIVLIGAINQVSYVVRICRLRPADLFYDPMHEDGAAGLSMLAKPAIEVTKASLSLLMIGLVFWVYDRIMIGAPLTNRTVSIALFTAIVFPLFAVPIARLHFLMCELRGGLLRSMCGGEPRCLRHVGLFMGSGVRDAQSIRRLAEEIEATEKLRNAILSFPTWPLPTQTLVSCGAYFAGMASPAFSKLVPLVSSALGIAS
jgi:hypothetical protein